MVSWMMVSCSEFDIPTFVSMAMGHNLWLYFGVDEHPFATYFNVHQGYHWF